MDERTSRFITGINSSIPREMQKKLLTKISNPELDRAKNMASDRNVPARERAAISKMIDQGRFGQHREEVNTKATREIEKYLQTKIDSAIRSGEIKPDANYRNDGSGARRS